MRTRNSHFMNNPKKKEYFILSDRCIWTALYGNFEEFTEVYEELLSIGVRSDLKECLLAISSEQKKSRIVHYILDTPPCEGDDLSTAAWSRHSSLFSFLIGNSDENEKRIYIENYPYLFDPMGHSVPDEEVLYILMITMNHSLIPFYLDFISPDLRKLNSSDYYFNEIYNSLFYSAVTHRLTEFLKIILSYNYTLSTYSLAWLAADDERMSYYVDQVLGKELHNGIAGFIGEYVPPDQILSFHIMLAEHMNEDEYASVLPRLPKIDAVYYDDVYACRSLRKYYPFSIHAGFSENPRIIFSVLGRIPEIKIPDDIVFSSGSEHFILDYSQSEHIEFNLSQHNVRYMNKLLSYDFILPEGQLKTGFIHAFLDLNSVDFTNRLIKRGIISNENIDEIIRYAVEKKHLHVIAAINKKNMCKGDMRA